MKSITRKSLVPSLVILLLAAPVAMLSAQEEEPGGDKVQFESQSPEFRQLYTDLEAKGREFTQLREQIQSASGEDREALGRLAAEMAEELVADIQKLAENVVKREKDGSDVGGDREAVTKIFQGVSEFFRDVIDGQNEQMAALRKDREGAAPEDLPEIERRLIEINSRLDAALEILVEQVERREAFGLDSIAERQHLEDVLSERAELLMGRIELAREDMAAAERRLKGDTDNTELAADLDGVKGRLDLYAGRLSGTAEMMDGLGLETTDAQQLLFEITGEITTGTMSRDVLAAIFRNWVDSAVEWFKTTGPKIFFKLVLFALILLVFRLLSKIARRVVRKAIRTSNLKFSQLLERTALSVTGGAIMVFGMLVALSQLGIEVAPLLAGLGVAGFIVGFALQDTLANFAAGFMILLYRPYDVGDLIETAGAFGNVKDMTLVSTTLLTLDHQTLVIPNSKIWGDVIKNVTAQKIRRIDMVFGISYTDDIPHAESVLEEIVTKHEGVLESPEPVVKLHNLGDSSVDFVVRPWVKTDDYWNVYWDITREVKMRFDTEGISIPYPQRDVHVIQEGVGGD